MVPRELPTYSRREIEQRASVLLKARVGAKPYPPIDVEAILESMDRVVLDVYPGLRTQYSVEGCVCKDLGSGKLWVYVDSAVADVEDHYRMVIAEELGHLALHRSVIDSISTVDDFFAIQQHKDWSRVEDDARDFGRAILMPIRAILDEASDAYQQLVDIAGFRDVTAIEKYLRNLLAESFGVRPADIHRRLVRPPCDVYARVRASVSARSEILLAETEKAYRETPAPSDKQRLLWEQEIEELG